MSKKLIPHTANSLTLAATNKPGDNEHIAMSQKGATELLAGASANFIEDAPQDGKMYVRKDGAWVELVLP